MNLSLSIRLITHGVRNSKQDPQPVPAATAGIALPTRTLFFHCFSIQHIVNQVSEKEGLALSMDGYKAKILLTCFLVHFVTLCVNFISMADLNK